MALSDLIEKLVSCIDCKQGAVRAVRFNGEYNRTLFLCI